jgi:hypothetical protein
MQRRSVVARFAATIAGLSLGKVPDLKAAAPLAGEPFAVRRANLPESSGAVTCPGCHEMGDSLDLTPAGLCLRCADRNPGIRVEPHSDPFWILSPREIRRLEREIRRLAAQLERMNERFSQLKRESMTGGGDVFDRAMERDRERWHAVQRELRLLHLLRAASRQFAG